MSAAGMAIMAIWGTVAGLLVGTAFFAIGASLLYPALLLLALSGAPESERGSVVGTFSAFFDLSQGLGSLVVGATAAATSYRGAFGLGAVCSVLGFVWLQAFGLRFQAARRERLAHVEEAGALAAEHPGP
jgi:predicted MFS family arabinose efflux permease